MQAAHEEDLDLIVEHAIARALDGGYPPRHLNAWMKTVRADLLSIERRRPGHIERTAAGLRARERGTRVTGWRENRGTHGISYDRDPNGTDRPPWL